MGSSQAEVRASHSPRGGRSRILGRWSRGDDPRHRGDCLQRFTLSAAQTAGSFAKPEDRCRSAPHSRRPHMWDGWPDHGRSRFSSSRQTRAPRDRRKAREPIWPCPRPGEVRFAPREDGDTGRGVNDYGRNDNIDGRFRSECLIIALGLLRAPARAGRKSASVRTVTTLRHRC
jgi:hypothetical protein